MSTLTDNYARAVVEAAGPNVRKVERALVRFIETMDANVDLSRALASPAIDFVQQQKIVEAIAPKLELPLEAVNFLKLVARKHRMKFVREMVAQLTKMVDGAEGIVSIEVTTARDVDAAARQQFESTLARKSNARFAWKTNPALLGGAVVRIGDSRWDGSVLRQLDDLRHKLTIKHLQ